MCIRIGAAEYKEVILGFIIYTFHSDKEVEYEEKFLAGEEIKYMEKFLGGERIEYEEALRMTEQYQKNRLAESNQGRGESPYSRKHKYLSCGYLAVVRREEVGKNSLKSISRISSTDRLSVW